MPTIFNALLFLISCLLYLSAPKQYDGTIIIFDLILFLIGSVRLLWEDKHHFNVLSFNFIFLLSFFFCTYSYALFVIGAGVEFTMTVFAFTDFNYITKGVSLSTIAITVYFWAYSYSYTKKKPISDIISITKTDGIGRIGAIRFFLAICAIANAVFFIVQGRDSVAITTASFIPELYKVFLIVYLLLNRSRMKSVAADVLFYVKANRQLFLESAIICFLYILVGDRGLPISIAFIYLGVYSFFYKKIGIAQFAVIAIIGVLFLFAIRVTRITENSFARGGISAVVSTTQQELNGQSSILLFSDLMGASSELCLGYEYVDKFGIQYPGKVILIPLQPIPLLPSLVAKAIWGKVPYELAASSIMNDYLGKAYNYNASLGNHIVADIYIHWGLIGVILFFALFGRCIRYIDQNKYSNLFVAGSFILAVSYALYLPRDSIFTLLRPIIFIWFVDRIFKLTRRNVKCNKKFITIR